MLPKPSTCIGCPLYGDGQGFVPDEIVQGSSAFILGQNPGEDEEREGKPFVGATGQKMEREYFPLAGLERGSVSIGNVLRCRDNHHNDLPIGDRLSDAVHHCTRAHMHVPEGTKLVIAQGHLAWAVVTGGKSKISEWRGFLAPAEMRSSTISMDATAYAVLHLSDRNKDHAAAFAARKDWFKVRSILAGTWPVSIPLRLILERDDQWAEAESLLEQASLAPEIAVDTEFTLDGKMTVLGIGWTRQETPIVAASAPSTNDGVQGLQIQWMTSGVSPWVRAKLCDWIQRLARTQRCVFHNAVADLPILRDNMGVPVEAYMRLEDTMLAHAVLWSELPHDLEFLASLYGRYNKLKHLRDTDFLLYNFGDVLATLDLWHALEKELANDKGSRGAYETQLLPLIPTIVESQEAGLLVNKPRVVAAKVEYERILEECHARAAAFMGYPYNLGSEQQLKHYLYTERTYPVQKDPSTHKPSSADAAINALRRHVGPEFDPEEEERKGGLTLEDAITRTEEGGDPVLELRAVFASALQSLSHYIRPCTTTKSERIYPRFATHAQADGRWSTTDPPLAQLPYALRDIIQPDPGWCWIGWDWSNIEPRLKCAYTGSEYLKRVFDNGWDLHTLNFCAAFNRPVPPVLDAKRLHDCPENLGWRQLVDWRGKDDVRRVFCKRLQYKMDYGGMPETAFHIPGAAQLGLTRKKLVECAHAILNADPLALAWRRRVIQEAQRTRKVRTFTGRVRRLLGTDLRAIAREAINFPMQAGVSDVFNLTVVAVKRELPWLRFAWQMHDSQWWACPLERLEESKVALKKIAERPFMIEGKSVCFPADFKVLYNNQQEVA